jgi:Lectin C-type domain
VLVGVSSFVRTSAALAAALASGCFDPRPQAGGSCAPGDRCPSPLTCLQGICVDEGGGGPDELIDGRLADAASDGPVVPLRCPPGFTEVLPGVCHRKYATSSTWPVAEARCEQDGGHLVIPSSLREALLIAGPTWIGLTDRKVEAVYRTVTGSVPGVTYWRNDMASPSGPLDCVFADPASRWQDVTCDFSFPFVCEYDGAPADPTAF